LDKETINSFLEVIKNYGIIEDIPENIYFWIKII
jgi:hypothetical protein